MNCNEKYSFKDFTHQSFRDVTDLIPGMVIVGSCFYQENKPDSHIFPETMTGVTFLRCNLDNIFIPPGNTVGAIQGVESTQKRIKVQNDGYDWLLDEKHKPIEPYDKKALLKFPEQAAGRILDPKDLPAKHYREEEMTKAEFDDHFVNGKKKHQWFKAVPEILEATTTETTAELLKRNLADARLFDQEPQVDKEFQRNGGKYLVRVDQDVKGNFIPIFREDKRSTFVQVKGAVTRYKIRGEAYLYVGQESEEVR